MARSYIAVTGEMSISFLLNEKPTGVPNRLGQRVVGKRAKGPLGRRWLELRASGAVGLHWQAVFGYQRSTRMVCVDRYLVATAAKYP